MLTKAERQGDRMCRLSNRFRMRYSLPAGLYALHNPTNDSPVFVTANYRLSFNRVRESLAGLDAWILVLDTKGINVWCAAGKGTFGTTELVRQVTATDLADVVKHRTLIMPQLGAPGVAAHEVRKATGFNILYGPVRSRDLPAYLSAGNTATTAMRIVTFPLRDRAVLTPMELLPALKKFPWVILAVLILMGLQPTGIYFPAAFTHGWPIIMAGVAAVFAGTILTPVLLPWIPFRSFAAKGAIVGTLVLAPLLRFIDRFFCNSALLASATIVFFVALSSYLALNFTGCTTFTSMSGVKKEMRIAVPLYITACGIAAVLLVIFKLQEWRIL